MNLINSFRVSTTPTWCMFTSMPTALIVLSLLSLMIIESLSSDVCGTVVTSEGNTIELREGVVLSDKDFVKVHMGKLENAVFSAVEERNCVIQICGFTSYERPYTVDYIGSPSDYSDCKTIRSANYAAPDAIFNKGYNTSSISCACKKEIDGCSYTCEEKRLHLPPPFKDDECARLYQDDDCHDCYYESHILKTSGPVFSTDVSHHITSVYTRPDCVVRQNIPAFRHYYRFRNTSLPIIYSVINDTKGVMSAFDSEPETFTCECGINPEPPPTTTSPATTTTTTTATPTTTPPNTTTLKPGHRLDPVNISTATISLSVVSFFSLTALGILLGRNLWKHRHDVRSSSIWLPKYFGFRSHDSKRGSSDSGTTTTTNTSSGSGPLDYARIMSSPFNMAFDTSKSFFEMTERLGQGNYGEVLKAKLEIAVKVVKRGAEVSEESFRALHQEIKILTRIGPHPNVVRLIGINADRFDHGELYMLVEYCENGSLLTYLRDVTEPHVKSILQRKASASTAMGENQYLYSKDSDMESFDGSRLDLEELDPELLRQMYFWAEKIASGMDHISSMKVIHGDLAARNILLTHKLIPKIADFGLSRKTYVNLGMNETPMACSPAMPLRWLAPEIVRNLEDDFLEPQSDIWSYAICIWEIFTLGEYAPYDDILYQMAVKKAILSCEKPGTLVSCVTEKLFEKLSECWVMEPKKRPSFKCLQGYFSEEKSRVQVPSGSAPQEPPNDSIDVT